MPTGNVLPLFAEIFKDVRDVFCVESALRYSHATPEGVSSRLSVRRDLENALQAVSEDLHNQYMISYNPDNKLEGGYHEIRVISYSPGRPGAGRSARAPVSWMAGVPE